MSNQPIVFTATGKIRTFIAPTTGNYVIEASGAEGGAGVSPGGRGARMKGTFKLYAGDFLQILVGQQGTSGATPHQPTGGGGGGSFVWRGGVTTPLPPKPMLAAGGGGGGGGDGGIGGDGVTTLYAGLNTARSGSIGHGGGSDPADFHYSGGGGSGWLTPGSCGSVPTLCSGGEHWSGGKGANYCCNVGGSGGFGGGGGGAFLGNGSGGGGGYSGGTGGTQNGPAGEGGGSYNAGLEQTNTPGVQTGDGAVCIIAVSDMTRDPWSDHITPQVPFEIVEKSLGLNPSRSAFAGYFYRG
jgi:hypothetical protein